MTREIKSRGKRIDNGQWAYGACIYDSTGSGRVFIIEYANHESESYTWVEVDPATVGQFAGLLDKNGIEIYEGDLVASLAVIEPRWMKPKEMTGIVVWDSCGFGLKEGDMSGSWLFDEYYNEIIGNIYDNPKLLNQ